MIFLIVFIPVMILSGLLFSRARETLISEKIACVRLHMEQTRMNAARTADVCRVTAQAFSGNTRLLDYLRRVSAGEPSGVSVMDSLNFFRGDVSNLGRMVDANPYLYAFRIYVDSDTMPEMMPILYRIDQAKRLLRKTDMKVFEIGLTVGYSDEKHFLKRFKQIVGVSPSEYRKG
ncbi:hypothetical protein AGMMS49992_17710 [Clostridia bacterium]|nr:hypothetical protein AGMMS49992_17710 [Clostridia bacterium]